MLLHRHYRTVAHIAMNADLKYLLRDYFDLPRSTALMPALLQKRLGQADLVLALLRIRDAHQSTRQQAEAHIAALVGHPIQVGPGCLIHYRTNGPARVRIDQTPRIVYVSPTNPRRPNTDAHPRWQEYKVGRSVAQLRVRGITNKDIRLAKRAGWVRFEECVA